MAHTTVYLVKNEIVCVIYCSDKLRNNKIIRSFTFCAFRMWMIQMDFHRFITYCFSHLCVFVWLLILLAVIVVAASVAVIVIKATIFESEREKERVFLKTNEIERMWRVVQMNGKPEQNTLKRQFKMPTIETFPTATISRINSYILATICQIHVHK